MSLVNEIILIIGMMVVTFSIRYILLAFSGKFALPGSVEKGLRFVPPAVLTAIIVPSVLQPGGNWDISFHNAFLPAAIAAVVAGFISPQKVLVASISSGLIVFVIVRLFLNFTSS